MFGSDVLDAAAIGAGAALLGGIVAGIFSLLTAWLGSKSKRSEIAFEKRVEAFGKIYNAISDANEAIDEMLQVSVFARLDDLIDSYGEKDNALSNVYGKLVKAKPKVVDVYHANRVYLPPHIDKKIQTYVFQALYDDWDGIIIEKDDAAKALDKYLTLNAPLKDKYTSEIITQMHKFIGYK